MDEILEEFSSELGEISNAIPEENEVDNQVDLKEQQNTRRECEKNDVALEKNQEINSVKCSKNNIDPLSIENENEKELELMNDITRLQNELKTAANKVNTLQQQLQGNCVQLLVFVCINFINVQTSLIQYI